MEEGLEPVLALLGEHEFVRREALISIVYIEYLRLMHLPVGVLLRVLGTEAQMAQARPESPPIAAERVEIMPGWSRGAARASLGSASPEGRIRILAAASPTGLSLREFYAAASYVAARRGQFALVAAYGSAGGPVSERRLSAIHRCVDCITGVAERRDRDPLGDARLPDADVLALARIVALVAYEAMLSGVAAR
jgi:hypothetical protein